ncbi:hypothetical protein BCR44DRAFT_1495509 [Catenaria anguillulae PL171]|uniref:Uncharacterized protein n=1 Tax=Catenaria anguillulae PL171 TaxID=765915 RepID=A0A1Y2I2H2_9FUNG|nr:hypothetical protein BCR44DRAFT_1495509 [Catenaria anguillulae PL171]
MSNDTKILDFVGSADGTATFPEHSAQCQGDSIVTRLDLEAFLFGGQPNIGVRHAEVLGQFGLGDLMVPDQPMPGLESAPLWRQMDSEYASCVLKGMTIWARRNTVLSLRLHFACRPPQPSPTILATTATPTTSSPTPTEQASVATTNFGSSTNAATTIASSISAALEAFTTTITINSGSASTTFVTVITPGVPLPVFTVTLPGGLPVIITQVPGATVAFTTVSTATTSPQLPVPPSFHNSSSLNSVSIICFLIIALGLVVAALAASLTYLRMRWHSIGEHSSQGQAGIELSDI